MLFIIQKITFGTEIISSDVILTANNDAGHNSVYGNETEKKYMGFSFDFKNKYQSKLNNVAPFRGLYGRKIVAEYGVYNYTSLKSCATRIYFNIDVEANSQKFNKILQTGYETKSNYQQREYCINL